MACRNLLLCNICAQKKCYEAHSWINIFLLFAYDWLLGVRNVTMIWSENEGKKFAIHGERMKWISRVFSFWVFHLQKRTWKDERPHTYIIMMLEVMPGGNYTHSAHLTLKRFRRDSFGREHSKVQNRCLLKKSKPQSVLSASFLKGWISFSEFQFVVGECVSACWRALCVYAWNKKGENWIGTDIMTFFTCKWNVKP